MTPSKDSLEKAREIWIKWNHPPSKHITFEQANAMVNLIALALDLDTAKAEESEERDKYWTDILAKHGVHIV